MKQILGLLLLLTSITSCASIISKSSYPVTISSNPSRAQIEVVNGAGKSIFHGETPTTLTLKAGDGYFRGEDYTVTFTQDDYTSHSAKIRRGIDGWYLAGNLVVGGIIGWFIVDPITGAMWTLSDLHYELRPLSSNESEGINITTLDKVPDNLRSKMVKVN
jgi:hypothetical protein